MLSLLDTSFDTAVRVTAYLAVLAACAGWEVLVPRRRRQLSRASRWPHNLGLLLVDVAVLRIVAPGAAFAVAIVAAQQHWGILNVLRAPAWVAIPASVALLDLAIYAQHRAFHGVPVLWRLHRVHHADLDVDVTTGTRFHPFEILLSLGWKCLVILAIGAPAIGVLVFEVLLNTISVFNHANATLGEWLDRRLRWWVVTPDMHRVHHSIHHDETSSNFGFNMPWWDRLLGTYRAQPRDGHDAMTIGLDEFRDAGASRLDRLLLQPFLTARTSSR